MPYLAQRSGSVRGRALPGCLVLACALTLGAARPRARMSRRGCGSMPFPRPRRFRCMPASPRAFSSGAGSRSSCSSPRIRAASATASPPGQSDVVHSAVDNALAMIEIGKHDVVIVTGGDSGMNEFFVQGEVKSFADMRGRTLVVDAPDTAYALQAKKILAQNGLKDGTDYTVKPVGAGVYRFKAMVESKDNAAAILNLPFTVQAEQLGMKSLGRTIDLLGPYQAGGVFVMRGWARDHAAVLERYIAAYVEALRWTRDPANRAENIALLMEKLKISGKEAERTYELLMDPALRFHARTPGSIWKASTMRWRCAPRSKAASPPRPSAISTSAIMSGRFLGWAADENAGRPVGPTAVLPWSLGSGRN